ncbi:hypothetical protein [Empedobacter tilapiae]|uniref:Outer membrane protein beta-barrel domain-containing protein n=1 Tax=Empedobacter tilapiae TaxID=2491114 RepID=A0A4Z1B8Z5_9FLAO|nr:hypothetical protein [Empedobacter tilapiae]TGN27926.1 hypothetical protein E4J94_06855 [Empedobacter tilapiae]
MKKKILSTSLFILGLISVNAQEKGHFKAGTHVGIPIVNIDFGYSVNLGLDVAYVWRLNKTVELGATTGFSNYFGKEETVSFMGYSETFEFKDVQIIPLAATAKFNLTSKFFLGADLGYAFILNENSDTGAFYFQPKVGLDIKQSELYLAYKGMAKDGTGIGSINLGYAYNF